MKNRIKRMTASSTWSASADLTPVDLERAGLITEVTIRANITCTLTAAAFDDWFRRVIQNIKIEGDGGKTFLGMNGTQMSRLLSLWQETVQGVPTLHSNGAGIALASPDVGSTTFVAVFKFHPGNNPRDPFDLSACIPAKDLSTLQVLLTTTGNNVVDSGGNITAGTFNYEIAQVLLGPGDRERLGGVIMEPQGSSFTWANDADYSAFSKEIDLPTGKYLRSILLLAQDDTATVPRRKNDQVTGVKIFVPKTGETIMEQNIFELQQSTAARFGCRGIAGDVGPMGAIATTRPAPGAALDIVPAGWAVIDLRPFEGPYGLDLRNAKSGDLKLGLTIENRASGDDTILYYDQLAPVALK